MGSFFSSSSKVDDIPDLTGCVAIVSGANSGIGFQTVKQLARRGAKVYLGARSESKAKDAIQRLHDEGLGPNPGEIIWLNLDLTYPSKAKQAAEYILAREKRLDILDGLSENMVINHLSPFLFTNTLLPLLVATSKLPDSDVRIVNVSSIAHTWVKKPRYDSLAALNQSYTDARMANMTLYGYTKLANILYTKELQKRLDAQGAAIIVTAPHPGGVLTEGAQKMMGAYPLGGLILKILPLFTTPIDRAADPSLFAAASPAVRANAAAFKGAYLMPVGKITKPSADAQDAGLARDLWATSEQQLAVLGL
ncbi:NAD(P)-binding protein [Athelia psychrophila]|uniref:NAD(P)-binding protein n=1 Tax=Athelia psychrophila TaxID=1759441 RepID=A0A165X534_9AGAM|nr:NAD(P)-binding protein [Fibularhizoctonia sp. CBS 109695]